MVSSRMSSLSGNIEHYLSSARIITKMGYAILTNVIIPILVLYPIF